MESQTRLPRAAAPAAGPDRLAEWALPDKYQLLRVLGVGGMGTVLLARDRNLGRLVAVKLLRTECPDFLARLRSEARILARLEHPAIVRVHELDTFAGRTYLSMEYASGGNLALSRLEPIPLVRSLRGVVDALGHAHARGIVHRDVKPENVLLDGTVASDRPPRAILTDFGFAAGPHEDPGGRQRRPIVGTPLTMSPEQARGARACPASDVFSLGVTLYRQLTGAWPFRGRTVGDVLDAILTRAPEPMSAHAPSVPRRLEAIVMRCLEKDPAARFGSMQELGATLDRFLLTRSVFTLARGWLTGRRRADSTGTGPRIHPEERS